MSKPKINNDDLHLKGFLAEKLPNILFIIGAVGLAISLILLIKDKHHFMYSYLHSFSFFTTLTLGALFLVLIFYLTRAGWGIVIRRVPEVLMKNIGLMAIFFIPILFGLHDLYHWTHTEDLDKVLKVKAPYLNTLFFIVRAVIFFGIWHWLTKSFFDKSIEQDTTGDATITARLQKKSTYGILLFALTLTFGFIDWVMSLTPHWYSTIFGVYIFAGAIVCLLATTSIILMILRKYGYLKDVVTVEHFHDIGKLLYGFNIFWSYIAFSQYFLIWYSSVPEETIFFAQHFAGSWNTVAMVLAIGHFGVPFILFMSRHVKRNLKTHFIMAVWLIMMHILDLYWLILPNVSKEGIHISLADITCFIGMGGIYFGVFFNRLKKYPLIPIKDPRLKESLEFQNF